MIASVVSWLGAHYMALLSAWVVVHTVAQGVHAKYPTNKVAALWCAVNPLDVVKGLNVLGGAFVPPGLSSGAPGGQS